MSAKVHKFVLRIVAGLVLYTGTALLVDIVLAFGFGVFDRAVLLPVNVVIAAVTGVWCAIWNARQDDLEEKRTEVDS